MTYDTRTHADPASSNFYFYVYVRNTLDLDRADIVNNTPQTKHVFLHVVLCHFEEIFLDFCVDIRRMFMKVAQKVYHVFIHNMCECQHQGRILVTSPVSYLLEFTTF